MPLLNAFWESVVIALVTTAYGLRWERHYTAWISVVMNVVFTVILFASTDLPPQMGLVLGAYIVLGFVTAWRTLRSIFFLFGTKTFGALSLTVALAESGNLGWTASFANALPQLDFITVQYIVSWFFIAMMVQILGLFFLLFFPPRRKSPMMMH